MTLKKAKTLFIISCILWTISTIGWIIAFVCSNGLYMFICIALMWLFVGTNTITKNFVEDASDK